LLFTLFAFTLGTKSRALWLIKKILILQAHLKAAQADTQPKLLKELANSQYRNC